MGRSRTNDEFTALVLETSSALQRSALLLTGTPGVGVDDIRALAAEGHRQ